MSKDMDRTTSLIGLSDITDNRLIWRQLVAELVGTFLLTSIGVGACIELDGQRSHITIALAFGLLVATIVQAIGHVSGGHINPAVTAGLLVGGEIKVLKALCYIIVQVLGAVAGAALIRVAVPDDKVGGFGMTLPGPGISETQAFLVETLVTFVLVFVVMGVCDSRRSDVRGSAPLAIGLAVAAAHCAMIPFSGSSMNPARTFGPAVIMGIWDAQWVYWAGPILGAVLAGIIYRFIFRIGKAGENSSYDF